MEEVKNIEKTKYIAENQEREEQNEVNVLQNKLSSFYWYIHAFLFFLLMKG